jgi:hypothetical protein
MIVLRCLVAMMGVLVLAARPLPAQTTAPTNQQPPPASEQNPTESQWQNYFRTLVGEYRMSVGKTGQPLTLVEKPVLKWSQPVRGGQDGAVYLWVDEGRRPAAIGTFFIWPRQEDLMGVAHELQRLSDAEISGQWRDRIRWRPAKDSLVWQSVPDAAVPDKNPSRRAIQAREIARRFAATSVNRDQQKSELRLQPRPFYQYDAADTDQLWLGGALCSIAHGTDTEVILWLEARRSGDTFHWQYACARMSDLNLRVTLDDKDVWSADLANYDQQDSPYLSITPEYLRQPPQAAPPSSKEPNNPP